MDVLEAIHGKRAIRRFAGRPLEPADLARILDAGRRAGSSKNKQRRDFVVVTDPEIRRRLAGVGPFAGHVADATAAVALVTPDPREAGASPSIVWDCGLAAESMMLAAWSLGVGSCPATVYDQALAVEILGLPPDRWCGYILSFGYPADPSELTRPPRRGGRRPLDDVIHRERW